MELSKNYLSVYYIGLNDKDLHTQRYDNSTYIRMLRNILIENNVESYTYYIVNGMFKDEQETTIKLEILNSGLSDEVIETIKTVFNQECILDLTLPIYHSGLGLFR